MPAADNVHARRRALFAAGAVVVAIIAGLVTYQLQDPSRDGDTAIARVGLDDRAVGWPFFNAVIETQNTIITTPEALGAVAERASASGRVLELDSTVPVDQTAFDVVAVATSEELAIEAADLAVLYLIETSTAERTLPLTEEIETRQVLADEASAEIAQLREEADGGVSDERLEQIRAEISAAFSREAVANSQIETLEAELAITRPQVAVLAPARLDSSDASRLVSALAAAFGTFVIALILTTAIRPRPGRRNATESVTVPLDAGELQMS